jgi:hypothetical protein
MGSSDSMSEILNSLHTLLPLKFLIILHIWAGGHPFQALLTQDSTTQKNALISVPRVRFKPTKPTFEWSMATPFLLSVINLKSLLTLGILRKLDFSVLPVELLVNSLGWRICQVKIFSPKIWVNLDVKTR